MDECTDGIAMKIEVKALANMNRCDLSYTQNRELSWLKFNERVLNEAADPTVPLIERLRFISIFTSNLDEFFMVRVGSLFDLVEVKPDDVDNKSGLTASQQLDKIFEAVRPLLLRREQIYSEVRNALALNDVTELSYHELTDKQRAYINDFYKSNIKPVLSPQVINRSHPFPHLRNKALYAAALLSNKGKTVLGIVDIPRSVSPILMLPGSGMKFVRTESVIAAHLKKIFKIYDIVEQTVISVTRNADISLDDEKFVEESPDFLFIMDQMLRKREKLSPVRLELESDAPKLAKVLIEFLKLSAKQVFVCNTPLKLTYAYMLNDCSADLIYSPHVPVYPEYLDSSMSIRNQVMQRDILLFYPYQSMQPFIDLLKESAEDPKVLSIKITIYRMAHHSAIGKALCRAAENGKEVLVLMELRARFDERNNIDWAREMEDAGCRIIYGPDNCKCHAKVCLITRQEKNGLSYITQIGTGNYNEKTSTLYTDFCLMTSRSEIAVDATAFFENMMIGNLNGEYDKLFVAPNAMRNRLIELIDSEIAKGSQGRIILKVNSVTERTLIDKLCEASCAGVRVSLIVRGICCLLPGIPGKTENITVTSIVGRFLEHARIYCFGEGNQCRCYVSSADLMTRNQTNRVEVACPVLSSEHKSFFMEYLERSLRDNVKSRWLQSNGVYIPKFIEEGDDEESVQDYYIENPLEFRATRKKQSWIKRLLCRSSS
ncbi:MAG: polyphosphate kinase 1 [Christensenellales bacterium]|nr:polyphosphate kinase 1 [Christensenellales bacterium]